MNKREAYRLPLSKLRFRDTFEPGVRVVHVYYQGKEGVGREPWPLPRDERGHSLPRDPDGPDATQLALDDVERQLHD